jgi:hypothetical protein
MTTQRNDAAPFDYEGLELWESVCETDPAYTKEFKRSGGFVGTAINATYLMRRATEKWGPCGTGWGWEIVEERILDGGPITTKDGHNLGTEKVHVIRLQLWYRDGECTRKLPPHFGQTTFVGSNKYGAFTDEEAPKKSLTDALTKSLSMLGFAADVHLGLFDDNKYVQDMRRKFDQQEQRAQPAGGVPAQNTGASEMVSVKNELWNTALAKYGDKETARNSIVEAAQTMFGASPDTLDVSQMRQLLASYEAESPQDGAA